MYSGETIKLMRLMKGLSQNGVAKKLGISQPAYCKLEKRRKVNRAHLEKILSIIKCSKEELEEIKKFTIPPPPPPRKVSLMSTERYWLF
ncbi:MAG: helix-turn-helix transcriptional regulator [Bacteroidetes bacterium]|nr:helix-turn-helix transcriptional regulator [Bacteroidota bacterium]